VLGTLVFLSGGLFIAGAALLFVGLRGRRLDDHPLCRRCGFDVFGTPEPQTACPECGADLPKLAVTHSFELDPITATGEFDVSCKFEVVDRPTVGAVEDERVRAAVIGATAVTLRSMKPASERGFYVRLEWTHPPVPLACEVWMRAGDQELKIGSATAKARQRSTSLTYAEWPRDPKVTKVDLVFRPSGGGGGADI
jgi:hypothetical protein